MPWSADVYAALGSQAADPSFASRGNHPGLAVLARIKPGVSRTQAGVDLNTVMRRLAAAYPVSNRGETATAVPLDQYLNGAYRSELWLLLGAVGLVLLLACANLAQLLLAHTARRKREFAIRSALGASGSDLLRQSACETLVLALVGGGLGALLARAAVPLLTRVPYPVPRPQQAQMDATVLAFAAGSALCAALLVGLAPALTAARFRLSQRLGPARRPRFHAGLLLIEAALAMVVVAGAGLLGRSLSRALAVDPGFPVGQLITLPVSHDPSGAQAYFQQSAGQGRRFARSGEG